MNEFGNDEKEEEKSLLHMAVEQSDFGTIQLLLNREDIDINEISELCYYSDNKESIAKRAAYHIAIEKSSFEIISLLLTHPKIDINAKSINYSILLNDDNDYIIYKYEEKTSLHIAIEKRNLKILQFLLNHQEIDINSKYLYRKDIKLKENIDNDIYEKYEEGHKTLFHIANEHKRLRIIQYLISLLDVNILNEKFIFCIDEKEKPTQIIKKNVLQYAIEKSSQEIIMYLMNQSKIDFNKMNSFYFFINDNKIEKIIEKTEFCTLQLKIMTWKQS